MRLHEYLKAEKEDSNLWWRLQSGEQLNLLEEALDYLAGSYELLLGCALDFQTIAANTVCSDAREFSERAAKAVEQVVGEVT